MNIILIYADDLGREMLGCYGQQHVPTPHIDALAADNGNGTPHTHTFMDAANLISGAPA